jgi:hypothetical protein
MTSKYLDFFVDSQTTRVGLTDDHWVDIKSEMSIGDWEIYEASILQIVPDTEEVPNRAQSRRRGFRDKDEAGTPSKVKMGAGYLDLLAINIVSWSFEGVHLNRSTIGKLKNAWASQVITAIEGLNPENPLGQDSTTLQTSPTRTS